MAAAAAAAAAAVTLRRLFLRAYRLGGLATESMIVVSAAIAATAAPEPIVQALHCLHRRSVAAYRLGGVLECEKGCSAAGSAHAIE